MLVSIRKLWVTMSGLPCSRYRQSTFTCAPDVNQGSQLSTEFPLNKLPSAGVMQSLA